MISRRNLLIGLVAAPAIVKFSSLMPVKAYAETSLWPKPLMTYVFNPTDNWHWAARHPMEAIVVPGRGQLISLGRTPTPESDGVQFVTISRNMDGSLNIPDGVQAFYEPSLVRVA